jgi:dolichyl-phosphate beta-glucosyltransferase
MEQLDTSIIIPAFNESKRLALGFERLFPTLEKMGMERTEVIVIDDGSSDDTLRVAGNVYGHLPEKLFVQQPSNMGKGAAVRLGISLARANNVIVADADMAIDPRHFPDFIATLKSVAFAPGSRASSGRVVYQSPVRTFASSVFHHLVHHYAGTDFRDTQCGAKGFERASARLLGLLGMMNGFAYDVEMFYLAALLDMPFESVNVTWDDAGSTADVRRATWDMLRDLRRLRRTRYENPVVELASDVAVHDVAHFARQARVQGLVLARSENNTLCVLPRDGSLAGLGIAAGLKGQLRTARLEEFRSRALEAV